MLVNATTFKVVSEARALLVVADDADACGKWVAQINGLIDWLKKVQDGDGGIGAGERHVSEVIADGVSNLAREAASLTATTVVQACVCPSSALSFLCKM